MNCVPLISDEALLRLQDARARARPRQRIGTGDAAPLHERLTFADERQREMGERREITARADRSTRRHDRHDAAAERGEEKLDRLDSRPGVALRDRVRAKEHRRPDDLVRVRLPDAAGVAAEEAKLQLLRLLLRNRLGDEAAEPGVDAVRVLAAEVVEKRTRLRHPLDGAVGEGGVPRVDRHVPDVVDDEVVARQEEHAGHGSRV
jgi:hypothetical protein